MHNKEREKIQYMRNMYQLERIMELKDGWFEDMSYPSGEKTSKAFEHDIFYKIMEFLDKAVMQPEIFPCSAGYIQCEYDNSIGDYLEFQINSSEKVHVFIMTQSGETYKSDIVFDMNALNTIISLFMNGKYLSAVHEKCSSKTKNNRKEHDFYEISLPKDVETSKEW